MTPDYGSNDPKGWCGDPSRGAALGDAAFAGTLYFRRIPLDSGGYDPNGTYFGDGAPLYWYASEDGEIDVVLRATDGADAREQIQLRHPAAEIVADHGVDFDAWFATYVETALACSSDDNDEYESLDYNYSMHDIEPASLAELRADAERFLRENALDLSTHENPVQGAEDFWLTQNESGAGFWDGDWPEPAATRLTEAAQAFGGRHLCVGDDGRIYVCSA